MRNNKVKLVKVIDDYDRYIDSVKSHYMIDNISNCRIIFKIEDEEEETPLGVVEYRRIVGDRGKKEIYIDYIEIFREYRYKGYGREVIELLKEEYEIIEGISVIDAIGFWKSIGCIYENNIDKDDKIVKEYYDNGLCLPFIIYKE